MTAAAWRVVPRSELGRFDPVPAPAYCASDRTFALYNDYEEGGSVLVPEPPEIVPGSAFQFWERGVGNGPRPLAPQQTVDGYGIFTFPYGPVSMGVPEAGRFDVRTYGERVLDLGPIGGFKPRRILSAIVGLPIVDAALQIERLAGHVSAAHTAAFLAASESAEGRGVSRTELWVRALGQELQRIYNHVHVIARVAEAAAQNVGLAQAHALAEELLRLQGHVFGHRWLFGAFLPGGPRRRLEVEDRSHIGHALKLLGREFDQLWELFLGSRTFVDRLQLTAPVTLEQATHWGAVGPTLRATGVAWDDRLRIPVAPYDDLFVSLPREQEGDALARVGLRADEVRASFLLLEQMLGRWPSDPIGEEPAAPRVAPHRGIGRVEAPSGDTVYDVTVLDGRVRAVGLRSASDANWALFAVAMREAVFTDFHFAFESFGLSFAETDG